MASFSDLVVESVSDGVNQNILLRREDSQSYFPVQELQTSSHSEDEEDRVDTFEGWRAKTSATVLILIWSTSFVSLSYVHSTHWRDWVGVAAWHSSLWLIPRVLVHRPKTPLNVAGFTASLLVLLLQPHMDIAKRLSYIGAAHGSASVMVGIRSLEYYLNQEEFPDWTPWRRMFFISAWGWHDFRQIKFVGRSQLGSEFKRLLKWSAIMILSGFFHVWWGKPSILGKPKNVFAPEVLRYFLVRWGVGFWTLLAFFNAMDAFPRALHFWADGHELRHISEDPWGARTLRDFWGRRWNVPVQDLLMKGVFKPISKAKWLPFRKSIAKIMVFFVSASAHTYAISCGGLPWPQLFAMYSFFMVQVPLLALEDTFKLEGFDWMLGSQIAFAPLFIEPCLTFVHL